MIGFSDIPEISRYATSVDVKFIVLTVLSAIIVLLIFILVVAFSMPSSR